MNIKKILLGVWIMVICFAVYYLYTHEVTPTVLREYFVELGPWAAIAFIVAYTIRPIVFFPASVMTPLSALLFGPLYGWIFSYIGSTLSATVAFFVAKYFGKDLFSKQKDSIQNPNTFTQFIVRYKETLEKNGLETVLFLRLVPLFPFDFVNYACGLSTIKYRTYLIGTLVGIIPGLTAFIFLGGSITNPRLLIPTVIAFAGLTYGAKLLKKKRRDLATE